ncbi:MAG: WxcM-like domain-containing protein [Caldilineaceae bacterium]
MPRWAQRRCRWPLYRPTTLSVAARRAFRITSPPQSRLFRRPRCRPMWLLIRVLPEYAAMRDALSLGEVGQLLPSVPQRHLLVYQVPSKDVRGEHSHRTLEQSLVCLQGAVSVVVDDSASRVKSLLNRPTRDLATPPLEWAVETGFGRRHPHGAGIGTLCCG